LNLDGLLVPNVTPFDAAGEVDHAALERVVEFLVTGGVDALVPCGTTGEYYALRDDERIAVLTTVARVAGGRVRLIAGANAGATRDVIAHARVAADLGYEGLLLAAPYYSLPTAEELVAHFKAVAAAVPLPILLYNYPARAGVHLDFDVLDGLVDCQQVVGIKESSGDIGRLYRMRLRYGDRYRISCGADDQALDYFLWGVTSWVAGSGNVAPRPLGEMMRTAVAGDLAGARQMMTKLMPVMQGMEAGRFNQKAKLGLALNGVDAGSVRAPLQPLSAEDSAEFTRTWRQAFG